MSTEFFVSPNLKNIDFSVPLSTDDKIRIFTDRTLGWQLDIADCVINGKKASAGVNIIEPIQHSGFAVLFIVTSYFEMIAKYMDGYMSHNRSKEYFKKGVYSVFPDLTKLDNGEKVAVERSLDILYRDVRCSLYHGGLTSQKIVLTGNSPEPIGYNKTSDQLVINPHLLVPNMKKHFGWYVQQLTNKVNTQLRSKFEARFDFNAM